MIRHILQTVAAITFLISSVGFPLSSSAQLKITHPISRMVVQRDVSNQAAVQIAGSYNQAVDLVEARVVARVAGQGTNTNWTTLQVNPVNGQFNGSIQVKGGWYKIQVRGSLLGTIVASDSVDRFGVGEVFAIMGHSNAQGSSCIINGQNHCPTIGGAIDERVNVIGIDQRSTTTTQYLNTAETRYLPGLAFSQLLLKSGSSPFGDIPWLWGHMGDELVSRINVPVLLYNAGFGGTNMEITYKAAYDIPFQHGFCRYDLRMPFVNIRNVMNLYVPTTGIRAVLILHGENDRGNPQDSTYKYYTKVIDKMRLEFNMPNLACIVAISSYTGARFDNVRAAQFQVINQPNYKAFMGPDLDNIYTLEDRPDGAHYSPTGQVKVGDAWAAAINNVYASISPYPGLREPMANISCGSGNTLTLSQPTGYQYEWDTGSTSQSLTVATGTYSARIKDSQSRIFFSPALVVPATVRPNSPTVTTDNGTWNICRTTGLRLTSSYSGVNTWSTGASSLSINVTTPGVYSLQAKHPVYGCLSSVVSQTVGLSSVSLALSMQTAKRVVNLSDPTQFNLLVRNTSACDAGPISVISRLPPNVSIVSTSASMTVANGVVSTLIPALPAGSLINQTYTARLDAAGYYRATAEITATTNTALNSTPNNGTGNGEVDEASIDLRTKIVSSAVYQSPNPNQRTLPIVKLNQPVPDPSKADLSLQLLANRLTPRVNQLVEITLVVKNEGGLASSNVLLQDVLPANCQFVSSTTGMSVSNGVVSGLIAQIAAGQSTTMTFTVRLTTAGVYTNKAQILSADQADSDSTPGNGYTNGEDDQGSIVLRSLN